MVFHRAAVKDLLGQWEVELQDGMVLPKICYCGAMVLDFPSSLGRAKPFSCLLTDSLALLERDLKPAQLLFNFFFFSKATVRAF